jgi:hypothetical protein
VGNATSLRIIGMLLTPKWHGMWPPGDLVRSGFFNVTVEISWVSTKYEEIKEWEAPESKSMVARKDWTRSSPSTTSWVATLWDYCSKSLFTNVHYLLLTALFTIHCVVHYFLLISQSQWIWILLRRS